ncbi:hypothetical protein HOI18_01555 [Candidatus Uhrbacteria bacterium]|jgi:hypothetical protein|nr:hypothetical protein [Candidatus Uhrbacteria bacterium]
MHKLTHLIFAIPFLASCTSDSPSTDSPTSEIPSSAKLANVPKSLQETATYYYDNTPASELPGYQDSLAAFMEVRSEVICFGMLENDRWTVFLRDTDPAIVTASISDPSDHDLYIVIRDMQYHLGCNTIAVSSSGKELRVFSGEVMSISIDNSIAVVTSHPMLPQQFPL